MLVQRNPARWILGGLILVVVSIVLLGRATTVPWGVHDWIPASQSFSNIASFGSLGDALISRIKNQTLGFEDILVVSLPERTDHRDRLLLASKLSSLDFAFVNGIHGDTIPGKTLPAGHHESLDINGLGAWRAHMNAIAEVVSRNLSSAIIMEDDVDWDVRLKSILQDFAYSSNVLLQSEAEQLDFSHLPPAAPPRHSPYGDGWDLLWLGHCGMHLPVQGGIVVHNGDVTVPETHYLHSWMRKELSPLAKYPDHTRAVFRDVVEGTCSLAYAVTQSAARNILYDLGMNRLEEPFDLALRGWCEGSHNGLPRVCLSVLPQVFDHYRRAGPLAADSDIAANVSGTREVACTNNIRWSVSMNMRKLLNGDIDLDDQYPDASLP